MQAKKKQKKYCAVLVDAENTPYQSLNLVLDRLKEMGYNPETRKAYGDWSNKTNLKPYNGIKKNLSFTKVDAPACVSGKGTSDVAMTVGAMDILSKNPKIGCFALVSSDSDFSPLVTWLNQAGKATIGFGQQKTPKAMVKKYKEFVFLDNPKSPKKPAPKLMKKKKLNQFLSTIILEKSDSKGWVSLATLGKDFDHKEYGCETIMQYFDDDNNTDHFELDSSRTFVRIHLPKDQLEHLGNLIVSCHDEDNWAPIQDLEEKFDARLYGYDDMNNLLGDFRDLFLLSCTDRNSNHLFREGEGPSVRNKVPKKFIQKLKKVVEAVKESRGEVNPKDLEPHFNNVDWRRFGYNTLSDLFHQESEFRMHRSEHFRRVSIVSN